VRINRNALLDLVYAQSSTTEWSGGRIERKAWGLRIMLRQTVEEHCIEERFVHLDSAVVVDESQPGKSVHEEADA